MPAGISFKRNYVPPEFAREVYRGLLMDEEYYNPDVDSYVPYDEEFMMSPHELELYRRMMQLREGAAVGQFYAPLDETRYRSPSYFGLLMPSYYEGNI